MKIKSRLIAFFVLLVSSGTALASATTEGLDLLPKPRNVEVGGGYFDFVPTTTVFCGDMQLAEIVGNYITTYRWRGVQSRIEVTINPALEIPAEGYSLVVAPHHIKVEGVDYAGAFYGFQTLLQLFPPDIYEGNFAAHCAIPCVKIVDWPEYPYRGMHLDVARTYSTIEELEEFISHLSHHKINHLHLHITDDEGWRVEITTHPKLTEIGAWRGGDSPIWPVYGSFEEKYGGYYTQEELKHLVSYAAKRGITIVPEIDLPGHSLALSKVYPEVLCPVHRDNEAAAGYDRQNVWCVAREANYELLDDILSEICDIFPSKYIHIGGDEVATSYWRDCPHCSALMQERGVEDYRQLQQIFMERVAGILAKYGRKSAMWNEAILGGTLPRDVRIHGWEGVKQCREAAEAGYPTVVMPGSSFYYDMRQSKYEDGHNWAGVVTTQNCYAANLDNFGFSDSAKRNVVGFSGAFWSELLLPHSPKYENYLEYQTFPRICALAELCWTPEKERVWEEFSQRLDSHKGRLGAMGVSYRKGAPAKPVGRQITPAMKVTTSLPMSKEKALARLSTYANDWGERAKRTCQEGDWILYQFDRHIGNVTVELTTGYRHITRGLFPTGVVELSSDGNHFHKEATLHNGSATIKITRPVRAIRLRSTATGNGDAYVYVQYPVIREID